MLTEKITRLLTAGYQEEALEEWLLPLTEQNDPELYQDFLLLSGRIQANNRLKNLGTFSEESFLKESNLIQKALLDFFSQIQEKAYYLEESPESIQQKIAHKNRRSQRILFIAANPKDTPEFDLAKEYLGLRKIFKHKRKEYEVTEMFDTSLEDFYESIRQEKPQILHVSAPSTEEFLALRKQGNEMHKVPYEFLSPTFQVFKDHIECVFFNTWCSPIFLKKVSRYLGIAIGSKGLIGDTLSITFSSGFYSAIAQGKSYEAAFSVGNSLVKNYQGKDNIGADNLLLFKDGICLNQPDTFPDEFIPQKSPEGVSSQPARE